MKLFNLLALVACIVTYVFAANYQTTFYGCPDECHTQEGPACGSKTYPLSSGGTKYFVAISTRLSNHKSYCKQRLAVMLADGTKTLLNVEVADFCGDCDPYHIDLSSYAFKELLNHKDGVGKVVWAIYNESGKRLTGPHTTDIEGVAKKFSLSKSSFTSAFDASAKKLISSGRNVGEFNPSARLDSNTSTKKTTTKKSTTKKSTTKKTTTTTKRTTTSKKATSTSKGTTTDGKCGQKNGKNCHSGECCSKYGYCGTSSDYCKTGCQREFGHCW